MFSTIPDILLGREDRLDETALVATRGIRTERMTWGGLTRRVFQVAVELEVRGVGAGDRVLLWGENGTDWVAAFYAILLRGAIVVPLDRQSAPDFVARVLAQVTPRLALVDTELRDHLPGGLSRLLLEEVEAAVAAHPVERGRLASLEEGQGADRLAQIIFTSGTTAAPKGVCLTHANLLTNLRPLKEGIESYQRYQRLVHPVRILSLLPLSHVFGQMMGLFVPALMRTEVHYLDDLRPSVVLNRLRHERISVLAAVPRVLGTLRDRLLLELDESGHRDSFEQRFAAAVDRRFVRRWWIFRDLHGRLGWKFWAMVCGGATLGEELETFWQRIGIAVIQGYGMTETASLISVNHPFQISHGSIGKLLPGHELRLGPQGEILVRGGNVAAGYWQGEAVAMTEPSGWLATGDLATIDEGGNLYFRGRKREVIVTAAGINLHPEDLEAALQAQPEVRESCVLGTEGASGPEAVAVLLLREEGADGSLGREARAAAAVARANLRLNPSQQIHRWACWPEPDFPRTSTQKVRRAAVRAWYSSQTDGPVPAASPSEWSNLLGRLSGREDREVSSTLARLPLDSLGRVALISALEDRYQIELDEESITPQTTVEDLRHLISRQLGQPEREICPLEPDLPPDLPSRRTTYPYPRWSRWRIVRLLRQLLRPLLIWPFVRVMCWPRLVGAERLAQIEGPVLFVSNHLSVVDPALLLMALPRRWRDRMAIAMAGERLSSLRHPARLGGLLQYGLVVLLFHVFPLPQRSGFRNSFSFAGEMVDLGDSLLVFPEGRTTPDGKIGPFLGGIGLLVSQLGIPVVPLRIDGLFQITRQRRYFSRPGTVTVHVGESVRYAPGTDPATITADLARRVHALGFDRDRLNSPQLVAPGRRGESADDDPSAAP
jgi:long-chain acyl-CoA synthetase